MLLSVSPAALQSLVFSLVLSRLDYGNATLVGLSSNQLLLSNTDGSSPTKLWRSLTALLQRDERTADAI